MSKDEIDFETLNAYVDGELDLARRAEVADAVARDPFLARQVAALSRLKSGVADSVETPELNVDLIARRSRRMRPAIAIAAAIVLAVVTASAVFVGFRPGAESEGGLAWAVAAHRGWDAEADARPAPVAGDGMMAALAQVGPTAYVPELSAAKLRIANIGEVTGPAADGKALLIGYRGTRGCKISLLVASDLENGTKPALTPFEIGALNGYRWRTGGLAYVIMAEGMAPARFALIAKSVHRASLERAPLNFESRTALARSRAESPPCMA